MKIMKKWLYAVESLRLYFRKEKKTRKWLYARIDRDGNFCKISHNKHIDVLDEGDRIFTLSIDYLNDKFHILSQLEGDRKL